VLVGRDRELAALRDALAAATRGEGGMVLLAGEAGIGKTRLGSELADWARETGSTALQGGCAATELALPYLPFLEALGNYVAAAGPDRLRPRLGAAAAELGGLFPRLGQAPAAEGDATHAKLRLYEAILRLLELVAADSALLLVLEDLHQADASTRELLDYLARRVRPDRILLLGTYRPEELNRRHPLFQDVQRWKRTGLAQAIALEPLDAAGVTRMLEAILDEDVDPAAGDFLAERSEGNPFVLEELLRESVDQGDVYRTAHGWQHRALSDFKLPATVSDAILLRVERLDPVHMRVLRTAAALGEWFRDSTLVAVAAEEASSIDEALAACVMLQLLVEEPGVRGTYRFRHALTQEAVYADLASAERQEYHRRAAAALRAQPDARVTAVAYHLFGAGDTEGAVPFCLEAARQAEEAWALADAAELYERALPYLKEPARRAEVLHRLGRCLTNVDRRGAASAAERHLQAAVRLLERSGDELGAARARVTLALAEYSRLRHVEPERELELAVSVLEPRGPSADLAEAYCHLAFFRAVQFDGEGCGRWAEQATAAAEAAGAAVAQVRARNLLGLSLAMTGRNEEAIDRLDSSLDEADHRGWSWHALTAVNNALLFLPLERWDEVPARLERMSALGPEDSATLDCHSWSWIGRGFPARAAEIAERARRTATSLESTVSVFWASCALGRAYASMGRLDQAGKAVPRPDRRMRRQDRLTRLGAELHVAVVAGDRERVLAAAPEVLELVAGWPGALESILAMQDLVDGGAARQVEAMLAIAPDEAFFRGLRIDLARAGQNHRLVLDAAPAFIELADRVDAPLFAGRARLALAEAKAAGGDTAAAAGLLELAVTSARGRRHRWQERQAVDLASALGVQLPSAEEPGGGPAEPSERFVTVLFADVRDFTAISQKLAPALLAEKIASFQGLAAEVVSRNHGTVDKFAGDAVMATFNLGGERLDHADAALKAALALREQSGRLGLGVGIGIATGPAIVGRLSMGANLSVLGNATNLASRLQAQAAAGEVLVSEEAWRHLREPFVAQPERLALKGFDQPVTAYRLRG